jgi:hypothetical protein
MATGFGNDLSCTKRLNTSRIVTGVRLLAEACYCRLTTWRGTLDGGPDEDAYGVDVSAYLGDVGPDIAAAALPAIVEAELLKDERISAVSASASASTGAEPIITLVVRVTPADETGDFALTLAISDVSVEAIGGLPS